MPENTELQEMEAGGSDIQGYPQLHKKSEVSQTYMRQKEKMLIKSKRLKRNNWKEDNQKNSTIQNFTSRKKR